MKGPTRSPAIRRGIERAAKLGFTVEFVEFVASAQYPGFPHWQGLCDSERKVIRVATRGNSRDKIAAILEHELEHAEGAEHGADRPEHGLRCGGTIRGVLAACMALAVGLAHAGFSCRDLSDPEGRRWFQDEPCGPGFKHDPLPVPPLIHEAPRIPDGAGRDGGGSEWQVLGFDERGRVVGVWVPAGRAVPFVSTDTLRVNGGRRGGGRWRR